MIAPCKDCEKRHFKCHADCERYKLYVEECRERRKERRENSEFVCYLANKTAKRDRERIRKEKYRRKVR